MYDDMAIQIAKMNTSYSDQELYWEKHEARNSEVVAALQDQVQVLYYQRSVIQSEVDVAKKVEATTKDQAKILAEKLNSNYPSIYSCHCAISIFFAEKFSKIDKLQPDLTDWRNQHNCIATDLEEVKHQTKIDLDKVLQVRRDADHNLVRSMKTIQSQVQEISSSKNEAVKEAELKASQDAVTPIINLFTEEGDSTRAVADQVKEVLDRLKAYMREMAKTCIKQVLGLLRVFFPNVELGRVVDRQPKLCDDNRLDHAEQEMKPAVASFVDEFDFT